nr:ribonuclease-like [Zootoca vivipara]XP_034993000.1 ribonuclease-like [Zootoca vivipara]
MAQTTACSLLIFLMVLPALTQRESRHEKFNRQHMDSPKTRSDLDARRYCNLMMQRRGMTDSVCKPSNTFIHGDPMAVDAICGDGGTHSSENYYDSNTPFDITACRIVGGGSQRPPCNYRGRSTSQRIRVACTNGVPVHFKMPL